MGEVVSSIFGGIGAGKAGDIYAGAVPGAEKAALTGYNYATGKGAQFIKPYQTGGVNATNAIQALLGLGGDQAGADKAFEDYKRSTGYDFTLKSGTNALVSSGASRGLLNSGGTAKAITKYGQDLGTQYFNNYLDKLSGVATQGLGATGQVINAGTTGGAYASNAIMQGAAGQADAEKQKWGGIGAGIGGLLNWL